MIEKEIRFTVAGNAAKVSAIVMGSEDARFFMVLAHGAGAGIRHPFMADAALHLAEKGIGTFRYHFPYMEQGKKARNPQPVLVETVRAAVAAAREYAGDRPLLAGGKSLGGRMTSTAASQEVLAGVKGIVFYGFPLHAAGKPSAERGEHLFKVRLPMLFLQGTRDRLADLKLLRPLCDRLRAEEIRTRIHVVEGADHGFHVPKASGRTDEDVLQQLAKAVAEWAEGLRKE